MTSTQDRPELTVTGAGSPQTETERVQERAVRIRRRLERLIGIAATEGNALTALRNGDEIFPAMLTAIRSAEHTVDMMTFVYWRGTSPASSRGRWPTGPGRACGCDCCWTASAAG